MKKLSFIITFLLAVITASAQESITASGAYECKKVFTADGVSASSLYVRALETLSDWAGSQQRSKANIDVQDKDEGLVVYKGQLYLGFKKQNFMCGWDVFADFTMKARCKDGKIQLTITVPSMSFFWSCNDDHETIPFAGIYPEFNYKNKLLTKKAAIEFTNNVFSESRAAIQAIGERITHPIEDDF